MIGKLLARNLRHQARLLPTLCVGLCGFEVLIVWISSRIDMGPGLLNMIELFVPPEFRTLIESQLGMATFGGAVAFGFRHPFVLTLLLAMGIVIGTTPAGERETGYLELLLARPVARSRYLAALVAHLVLGAVVLPAALLLGAFIGLRIVTVHGELPWAAYLPSAAAVAALMLAVGGYTLFIAAGARRRGSAIAHAAGWTLVFFLVDALALMWRPLTAISRFSPFAYCRPVDAAVTDAPQAGNLAILLGLFVVATGAALYRFQRQDL